MRKGQARVDTNTSQPTDLRLALGHNHVAGVEEAERVQEQAVYEEVCIIAVRATCADPQLVLIRGRARPQSLFARPDTQAATREPVAFENITPAESKS